MNNIFQGEEGRKYGKMRNNEWDRSKVDYSIFENCVNVSSIEINISRCDEIREILTFITGYIIPVRIK